MKAGDFYFKPNNVIVKVNVPVVITVNEEAGYTSHSTVLHAPEAGIDFDVDPGKDAKKIGFTPTRRQVSFLLRRGGDRDAPVKRHGGGPPRGGVGRELPHFFYVVFRTKEPPCNNGRGTPLFKRFSFFLELILHSCRVLELEVRVRLQFFLAAIVQVFMQFEVHFDRHGHPCRCQGLPQEALGL